MASSVDLLIRVLADTSHANAAFAGMSGNIGRAIGVGTAGLAVGGVVAETTKAAIEFQSAMAVVQAGVNSVDFAPGTAAFTAAKNQILKDSIDLGVGFDHAADVYAQSVKFVNDAGEHLSTDKMQEYTDTMLRLERVSQDHMSATDIGRRVDVFEKLYNQENFGPVGSAVSAESQIHNQGEQTILDTANALAIYGAQLGVTQAQAIGLGNLLSDVGAGGSTGGASMGRMFMRMSTSADAALDPEARYSDERKRRTAQEHLDDLQTSLREDDARQAGMYGQHGLKTQYQRNPAALMAEEDRRAKLLRDIEDAKTDLAHQDDAKKAGRGQMSVTAMAQTAGMSVTDFAQMTKDDPATALLKWTEGLHDLDKEQRAKAMVDAGIINTKDQKTINALADRPEATQRMIDIAQTELDNPTNLSQRSAITLDTTATKAEQAAAVIEAGKAAVGEPTRQGLDALLDGVVKLGKSAQESSGPVGSLVAGLEAFGPMVLQAIAPIIAFKLMAGGGAGGAAGGAAAAGAGGGGGGGVMAGAIGAAAAAASAIGLYELNKDVINDGSFGQRLSTLMTGQGSNNGMLSAAAPIDAVVHFGDIVIHHPGDIESCAEEVKQQVIDLMSNAWNAAKGSTPVPPTIGGNIGGSGPR